MKIIFLDIDGVMTSGTLQKEAADEKTYAFSRSSVEALNAILASNKARIILTSSWRTVFSIEQCCQIFDENGIVQMPRGATVEIAFESKSTEIRQYLENHQVESYVILDDMKIEHFDDHFLRIDPRFGLTMNDVAEANRILNISSKG